MKDVLFEADITLTKREAVNSVMKKSKEKYIQIKQTYRYARFLNNVYLPHLLWTSI